MNPSIKRFLIPFVLALFALLTPRWQITAAEVQNDPKKWEKDIVAFEAKDKTNPPPKGAIVFTGSSTIRLWKTLAQDFPGQQVINRGFGGCQIEDCAYYAERIVVAYSPRMVVLRAGGNDLWAGKTPERVLADFKGFVAKIREKAPATQIVFLSMSPSIARWKQAAHDKEANDLIQDYCTKSGFAKFVDTYSVPLDASGQPRPELFV